MLVRLAGGTQPNLFELAQRRGRAQLLTIPYSHFCELAKFSLTAGKVPFDSHDYAPGAHVLPTLAARISGGRKLLPPSSTVRGKGATTVPFCVLADGRVCLSVHGDGR